MPKAKKIGRPKLPKGHAKGSIVPVRVNAEQRKVFEKAAKAGKHKTLSSWIRHSLGRAGKAEFTHEMTTQLEETLNALHFDDSSAIIAHHISKMIEGGGGDTSSNVRLQKLYDAFRDYKQDRLGDLIPGYRK